MPDKPDYALINQCLYEGKAQEVYDMTKQAIDDGHDVREVLEDGLISGMSVVGEDFKRNILYVPEVLIAARAMKRGMEIIKPILADTEGVEPAGTLIIGTVKGDLHDIGKNLVIMMAEGAGYEVVDLGVDVSADQYISAINEHNAKLLGMSALLTTTMGYMATVIQELEKAGLVDVKTCIGGAPVTQAFADEIDADGYATDAANAVSLFNTVHHN